MILKLNYKIKPKKRRHEALERLQWKSFCQWLEEEGHASDEDIQILKKKKLELLEAFHKGQKYVLDHRDEIRKLALDLGNLLQEKLDLLWDQFQALGHQLSDSFTFWNEYISMVWLLLDFLHGERDSNWNLHLETFSAMLPYDRAYDHLNYFRWGTVYLVDMKMLPTTAPLVHKVFTEERKHAVSRCPSASSFNAVSPDMALEQTENKDSKTKGGIIGFSGVAETRDRWALTAHLMSAATTSFKAMSGLKAEKSFHKDLGSQRIERDEKDVEKIVDCILEKMVNPFDTSPSDGDKMPLVNIATGTVAPPDVTLSLLTANKEGRTKMEEFVEERFISGKKDFWDPVKKMNVKTFASLNKPLKLTKEKQTLKSIKIDRQVYSRLLVVSINRDVDLEEVHSYELAMNWK